MNWKSLNNVDLNKVDMEQMFENGNKGKYALKLEMLPNKTFELEFKLHTVLRSYEKVVQLLTGKLIFVDKESTIVKIQDIIIAHTEKEKQIKNCMNYLSTIVDAANIEITGNIEIFLENHLSIEDYAEFTSYLRNNELNEFTLNHRYNITDSQLKQYVEYYAKTRNVIINFISFFDNRLCLEVDDDFNQDDMESYFEMISLQIETVSKKENKICFAFDNFKRKRYIETDISYLVQKNGPLYMLDYTPIHYEYEFKGIVVYATHIRCGNGMIEEYIKVRDLEKEECFVVLKRIHLSFEEYWISHLNNGEIIETKGMFYRNFKTLEDEKLSTMNNVFIPDVVIRN